MKRFWIEIEYKDGSLFGFQVEFEIAGAHCLAKLEMITRGTLMASTGCRAVCYNSEGFDVCAYTK